MLAVWLLKEKEEIKVLLDLKKCSIEDTAVVK